MMKKIVVAIDGHSSCGKSTMAKALAREVGYIYVDTGAMYRMVTLYALRNGYITEDNQIDEEGLRKALRDIKVEFRKGDGPNADAYLNGENVEEEIRTLRVSNHVSPIATLGFVREYLVEQQQAMGRQKGIVMDGRDIGTVVFPDAELKIFVTASAKVRAEFRYKELKAKGQNPTFEDVLKNVEERDYIDSHREVSPLRKAPDAIELDCGGLTMDEQNQWLFRTFNECISR